MRENMALEGFWIVEYNLLREVNIYYNHYFLAQQIDMPDINNAIQFINNEIPQIHAGGRSKSRKKKH